MCIRGESGESTHRVVLLEALKAKLCNVVLDCMDSRIGLFLARLTVVGGSSDGRKSGQGKREHLHDERVL